MPFSTEDIRANREYFVHTLHAEKRKCHVLKAVEASHPISDSAV